MNSLTQPTKSGATLAGAGSRDPRTALALATGRMPADREALVNLE
jgi:hypothetical protein